MGTSSAYTLRFGYDMRGRQTVITYPNGTTAKSTFDDAGNQLTKIDQGGFTTSYSYDPLNRFLSVTNPASEKANYRHDAATELYGLRSRYYSPTQGRFLSQDKWAVNSQNPVELNRHVYTANNPINYSDPSGYSMSEYTDLLLGGIFGFFSGLITNKMVLNSRMVGKLLVQIIVPNLSCNSFYMKSEGQCYVEFSNNNTVSLKMEYERFALIVGFLIAVSLLLFIVNPVLAVVAETYFASVELELQIIKLEIDKIASIKSQKGKDAASDGMVIHLKDDGLFALNRVQCPHPVFQEACGEDIA